MKFTSQTLSFLLVGAAKAAITPLPPPPLGVEKLSPPPTILDTDFGSFIDDIFAVGMLVQSTDVLDPRLIITTQEQTELSAKCVWKQIHQSDLDYKIPIAIGETLPPNSERGAPCAGAFGKVGFALEDHCKDANPPNNTLHENGVDYMAEMLLESDRTDWVYIVIGGQTSLAKLIREYPEAADKIETLVLMGGNWCTGFDPYPGVPAPTQETNIACDMRSANYVLDANNFVFPNVYMAPPSTAAPLASDNYELILSAADNGNKAAKATIDFYKAWSKAARADPDLLIHAEAMTFDPATESTTMYDAGTVLAAMDVVRGKADERVAQEEFSNGVHFVTVEEENAGDFAGNPAAGFSLWTGKEDFTYYGPDNTISDRCSGLTNYTFSPKAIEEEPVPITAGLGFVSDETEADFYHEMALRMAGSIN